MVKINYQHLNFEHLVIFEKDSTVFAAARHNGDKVRIFLIYERTGNVYTRNGRAESWEELYQSDACTIRNRVNESRNRIPVYKVNGSHNN